MPSTTIYTPKAIPDFLGVAHAATNTQITQWLTGDQYKDQDYRFSFVEKNLPLLVKEEKICAVEYVNRLIYISKLRARYWTEESKKKIPHSLACTNGLVGIYRSHMDIDFLIPERKFRGTKWVPEWGIRYKNGTGFFFEYCSLDNTERSSMVKNKILAAKEAMETTDNHFNITRNIVLFVLDVDWEKVFRIVESAAPLFEAYSSDFNPCPFYFVPYHTFISEPLGGQLTAKIYLWGYDQNIYHL